MESRDDIADELAARMGPRRALVPPVDIPEPPRPPPPPPLPVAGPAPPVRGIVLPAIPDDLIARCDVAAIARLYSPAAMQALASILVDPDAPASAVAAASNALLERGHGKAVATTVMANPDGSALFSGVEIVLVRPRSREVIEHEPRDTGSPDQERDA